MTFQIKEGACRTRSGDKVNAKLIVDCNTFKRMWEIESIDSIYHCNDGGIAIRANSNYDVVENLEDDALRIVWYTHIQSFDVVPPNGTQISLWDTSNRSVKTTYNDLENYSDWLGINGKPYTGWTVSPESSKKSYDMRLMEGIFKTSEIQDCHVNGISPKKIAENPDIANDLIYFIQDNLVSPARRQS